MTEQATPLVPLNMAELRLTCKNMLDSSGIKPSSKVGRQIIHAFFVGAMAATGATPPFVVLMLSCGRQDELLKEPKE